MNEYMFRILNEANHDDTWSSEQHLEFVRKCEEYIRDLERSKNLIAAQPLAREGLILWKRNGVWGQASLETTGEIQVGYYRIRASDFGEAMAIAKGNPEFEYGETARIEIRPIEGQEESTGFVYPK